MTGYMCKYAPIELLAGFDIAAEFLLPSENSLDLAESHIYPSICSYAKSVLQHSLKTSYDAILFTDCCDAMKRVADVLAKQANQNVYQVGLPRLADQRGADWYADILERFVNELEIEIDRELDVERFLNACPNTSNENEQGDYVGIVGARASLPLLDECRNLCNISVRDMTCASQERYFDNPPENRKRSALMRWYASALLSQTPCLRMADTSARKGLFADPSMKGIIYHTIKFCDFYSFEYAAMEKKMPTLKLETDYTATGIGQIRTRLEAFFESTGKQKEISVCSSVRSKDADYYAGIDIGSTSTEAVILNSDGSLLAQAIIRTGAKSKDAANQALGNALEQSGLERLGIARIVTTGYGRKAVDFESRHITEISCHARGVSCLFPEARAIIDIGGQDSKVICLNADGTVADFAMNDKCAAGTGRFLELMSVTLGIPLEQMSELGLHWHEDVTISSMCAIFAESEVISLIAQNKETCDIIRGINLSIAGRVAGLVGRIRAEGPFVMSGGVAKNSGVLLALEQKLGQPILVAQEPQICGALGAALYAMT